MPIRPLSARILDPAIACIVVTMLAWPPGISDDGLLIASAQAQSKQQAPLESAIVGKILSAARLQAESTDRGFSQRHAG